MEQNSDPLLTEIAGLSPADRARVSDYVAFLRWQADRGNRGAAPASAARPWRFNFLEHLGTADVRASKGPAGMEVKAAEASVAGERRPALWQHPPVAGESAVEFHVPVPAGLSNLRLRFAIGIRDGAQAENRLVAFRVRVDGWQVWSRAAWPALWEAVELPLPFQAGNVLRLAFSTDGLGDHRFAWAAWAEPELAGELDAG